MSLAGAITTGDVSRLPSRRDEDWRWTDMRGLIRRMPDHSPKDSRPPTKAGPFDGLSETEVVVVNGDGEPVIRVERGERKVVSLRNVARAFGTSHLGGCRIEVGYEAELVLLESHESEGIGYIADFSLKIEVDIGGRLERIVLLDDEAEAVTVVRADVHMQPRSTYAQTVLTTGARRQRCETTVRHNDYGTSVRLDGAYLLAAQRHSDLTSEVQHVEVGGVTSQLTKGVVRDQARGVFQGRIVVEKGADGTEARMGHHALILSDKAEVDAKPELLIFADDVQCAHGNTVGALDEAAIFYARQRGMPETVARAMLTEAFVGEVVDRIDHEGAREIARAWVSAQLGTSE